MALEYVGPEQNNNILGRIEVPGGLIDGSSNFVFFWTSSTDQIHNLTTNTTDFTHNAIGLNNIYSLNIQFILIQCYICRIGRKKGESYVMPLHSRSSINMTTNTTRFYPWCNSIMFINIWKLGHTPINLVELESLLSRYNQVNAQLLLKGFKVTFRLYFTCPRNGINFAHFQYSWHFQG